MGNRNNLSGHCAIVTGAAGGIGSAFCHELASRGCSLILIDVSRDKMHEEYLMLRNSYPDVRVYKLPTDLTSPDLIEIIERFLHQEGLDPDILINNAGIFAFAPATEISDSRIDCFIDLHVRAVTNLSKWMASRRVPKGSGWILNMSSMSCWAPMPGLSMYAATKAYIRVFSRSLHYDVRDSGVRVMVACPGGIATDLFGLPDNLKHLALNLGAIATPRNFARKAVTRLMKGRQQYINGFVNRIAIFLVGIMPTSVRMMVKHRLLDKGIKR